MLFRSSDSIRAAVKALANIDCEYQVTSFNIDGDCKGYIERT